MLITSTTCLYCTEWAHGLRLSYAGCLQDDGYIPNAVEKQIFETMLKIRNRDSSIYDSKKAFFADASDDDQPRQDGKATMKSKASKPMLLKDVIAQQVIQDVPCQVCAVCLTSLLFFVSRFEEKSQQLACCKSCCRKCNACLQVSTSDVCCATHCGNCDAGCQCLKA